MRRWASNLLSVFSLLIFSASVGLWVRGYFESETVQYWSNDPPAGRGAGSSIVVGWAMGQRRGVLFVWRTREDRTESYSTPAGWRYEHSRAAPVNYSPNAAGVQTRIACFGFQVLRLAWRYSFGWRWTFELILPLWLFFPFAIPPLFWLRRRRKSRGRGFPVAVEQRRIPA